MKKRILLAPVVAIACMLTLVLGGCGGASAEDLIRENLESYMGEVDVADEAFVEGLESSAGEDLDQLGITADEFAAAYLDGFGYEIGDITVDGDTATAELTITVKSYTDIMTTSRTTSTTGRTASTRTRSRAKTMSTSRPVRCSSRRRTAPSPPPRPSR